MDFSPLLYRINRVLRGGRWFRCEDVCEKSWVICPAPNPDRKLPTAIALDGQFDRVTGLSQPYKTFERERTLLAGKLTEQRVTTAYLLKNATVLHGFVYKGPLKHCLVSDPEKWLSFETAQYIDKAAMGCTHTGNNWYSHWMTDNLTLELAAQTLGEPLLCQHKPYSHAADYRRYFELEAQTAKLVRCKELIVLDDVSQNTYKRDRYNTLRTRLRKVGSDRTGHGAMILRGRSGQLRLLVNELEVAAHLEQRGFTIIDPQKLSVTEIVRSLQGANIILGVEGSTMSHGFYSLADGGTICILQPPYRFNGLYKEYGDCVGMHFAYVVGYPDPEGFRIDLDELDRTLDLIAKETATPLEPWV